MIKNALLSMVIIIPVLFFLQSTESLADEDAILTGIFYGPVQGLKYETKTTSGTTNSKGEFKYTHGETVSFSIGGIPLGSATGNKLITTAHLVPEVNGDVQKIKNQKVTNLARFLQSLDTDGDVENGIVIAEGTANIIKLYRDRINFNQIEQAFAEDQDIKYLLIKADRTLRSAPQARNHLRRGLYGIKKMTDVEIPTRDGSYLLADVYRPIHAGEYPVVMSQGAYGKSYIRGCICSKKDLLEAEELEDKYFAGEPMPLFGGRFMKVDWEEWELANTVDWVPEGYVVIRVENRGICNTPGVFEQFSLKEAEDYYDAIEWAADQPWSNGNVGLYGSSYYAMNQYNVAQLQPPSLKAMIPVSGDIDSYRDYIFSRGGLYNTFNFVSAQCCGLACEYVNWINKVMENPFDDPDIYGPKGSLCISPDMDKVTVPFWSGMGIDAIMHNRGSSEAFIQAASENKKITVISDPPGHGWVYKKEHHKELMAFFDYWLKNEDNGIMEKPPVNLMIRTGNNGYYWMYENEWPLARTQYTRYYLDADSSGWEGDGNKKDFMKLTASKPAKEMSRTYSADVNYGVDPCWSYGISFITDPMPGDMVIAGYIKLVTWVSSTSHDMELHASIKVMDENNNEVPYAVNNPRSNSFPVSLGGLKVSHRKLDKDKSTIYRPYHTHLETDYAPLSSPDEVVEVEVELTPTTALIRKGHRIRLDIQPATGCGIFRRSFDAIDTTYQEGSVNTIYTGPDHISYVQLPVIPVKK